MTENYENQIINNKFLTFYSDDTCIAVDTNYVVEIITYQKPTLLPKIPKYIAGIINLRGQIIPVIDIRIFNGKSPLAYDESSCIVILNIDQILIGIIVDYVSQVIDLQRHQIRKLPIASGNEIINSISSLNEDTDIFILDCDALVNLNLLKESEC